MKKIVAIQLFLLSFVLIVNGQDYINNQNATAQAAVFRINNTGLANLLGTTAGTGAGNTAHTLYYGGSTAPATPSNANRRWATGLTGAETGTGNTGSNFFIGRYDDAGTLNSLPFTINRSTGLVNMGNGFRGANLSGITGTGTGVTNQAYLGFYESDGTTRIGYIGKSNTGDSDLYMTSANGSTHLMAGTTTRLSLSASALESNTGLFNLSNSTSNLISFNTTAGIGAPAFTTRSAGTKISLYSAISATNVDFGIGMENGAIWHSVPSNSITQSFKWYGGITQVAKLDGMGNLELAAQGRFKGWATGAGTTATGPAAELGVSGGNAHVMGYNRTTNTFIPLILSGGTAANNQTAVTINEKGVGIGTANPQSKLSVKGEILAQKVRVTMDAASWPDYVFAQNYQLLQLSDIEAYIKDHQHLPNIPSAQEIEKNGLDLGEMNKKLLQKIEELTLHLIQQQKEITALKEWKEKATTK